MKYRYYLLIIFILGLGLPALGQANPNRQIEDTTLNVLSDSVNTTAEIVSEGDDFVYPLTAERKELLVSYSKLKNIWRFVSFFVNLLILVVLLYTGLSGRLQKWAGSISEKKFFKYWNSTIF